MKDEKLLKLDGEYVKLYVTTNNTLPNLLKNSGAMTVLINKSEGNSIYLGNEMIAGGYGFYTNNDRLATIKILEKYPGNYSENELYANIIQERDERINAIDEINTNINNIILKTTDIGDTQLFIKSSNLPSNYYSYDNLGTRLLLSDFVMTQQPETYDKLEFNDITYDYSITFVKSKNGNFETTQEVEQKIIDGKIYVPYGSTINSLQINLSYDENDTGGISILSLQQYIPVNNELGSYEIMSITNTIVQDENSDVHTNSKALVSWKNINKYILDPTIYGDGNILKPIDNCKCVIEKTPNNKFKKFEYTSDAANHIFSTSNILERYEEQLDDNILPIHPVYLCYYTDVINGDRIKDVTIDSKTSFKDSQTSVNKYLYIIDDSITFEDITFSNSSMSIFAFALPESYSVSKVVKIENNKEINITGYFKTISNLTVSLNPFMYEETNTYNYSLYYIATTLFNGNVTIKVYIDKTPETNDNRKKTTSVQLKSTIRNTKIGIENLEFDSSHWLSMHNEYTDWLGDDTEYKSKIESLINKLI